MTSTKMLQALLQGNCGCALATQLSTDVFYSNGDRLLSGWLFQILGTLRASSAMPLTRTGLCPSAACLCSGKAAQIKRGTQKKPTDEASITIYCSQIPSLKHPSHQVKGGTQGIYSSLAKETWPSRCQGSGCFFPSLCPLSSIFPKGQNVLQLAYKFLKYVFGSKQPSFSH